MGWGVSEGCVCVVRVCVIEAVWLGPGVYLLGFLLIHFWTVRIGVTG